MDCEFVFSSINQTGPGGGAHITKAYFDDPIICTYQIADPSNYNSYSGPNKPSALVHT
jgi:hypothetical protein